MRKYDASSFVWVYQDCLSYLESFVVSYEFQDFFLFLGKVSLEFWWQLYWINTPFGVVWTFQHHFFSNPRTQEIVLLFVSSSFSSLMSYSFQCIDLSSPWFNLSLCICFPGHYNWDCFLNFCFNSSLLMYWNN